MQKESCDQRSSRTRPGWAAVFVLFLGLLSAGCGTKGRVSGKVLYKGNPMPGGTVSFFPTSGGGPSISRIHEDGTYYMEKVPAGKVKIAIQPPRKGGGFSHPGKPASDAKKATEQANQADKKKPADDDKSKSSPETKKTAAAASATEESEKFPERYSDPEKSGLEFTVSGEVQTYDIQLK